MTVLVTDRLVLRPWQETDRAPFAAINADPAVMRYFPNPLTRADSDALFERFVREWREGSSFHAVEEAATRRFIGFVGVAALPAILPIAGTQVGWRLASDVWGRGYAPEAARATMDHAFAADPDLAEIVSYTVAANAPSRRVMEKLGLERAAERDFEHPAVPEGNPLRQHILYRVTRDRWLAAPRG